MAYTPELSQRHSGTLRRIAWALEMPMTKAIEEVFDYLSKVMDEKKICQTCRDKSFCEDCQFNRNK
jgi:recombinational DNA repair protein RecR